MPRPSPTTDVYTEIGAKRVFACAIDWPGWSRSGRDERSALEALLAYGARYAAVVGRRRPPFHAPASVDHLVVVERLKGDATTDFGAPSASPEADARPIDEPDLSRLRRLLEAAWAALDRASQVAAGSSLRTGPRGGGRSLDAIVGHVIAAEASYIRRLAAPAPPVNERDPRGSIDVERSAALEALSRAVTDGLPERGPRGGAIWRPRFFVRRAAWHALDHAWEIEDRSDGGESTRT
jgi:hypothetical protein